nr:DUF58 domain-containing protein [Halorubellus sp. JP-L1]
MQFVGSIPTRTGGSGIEFHSTRNYRRGDPMNRIDWRRLAKAGELTTIDYRVQEAARVMVVVDARESVSASAGPGYPRSEELASYAAELLTGTLLDEGHEVGIAVFGMDLPGTRGTRSPSVLEPSGGETFAAHVSAVCSAVAEADPSVADLGGRGANASGGEGTRAAATTKTDGGLADAAVETARLRAFLDRHTQVLFVTPALDEFPVTVTETLEGHGHAVTVVSPDVTDGESLGGRLARVERSERVRSLRGLEATVVDWALDDPLPLALAPAFREVR